MDEFWKERGFDLLFFLVISILWGEIIYGGRKLEKPERYNQLKNEFIIPPFPIWENEWKPKDLILYQPRIQKKSRMTQRHQQDQSLQKRNCKVYSCPFIPNNVEEEKKIRKFLSETFGVNVSSSSSSDSSMDEEGSEIKRPSNVTIEQTLSPLTFLKFRELIVECMRNLKERKTACGLVESLLNQTQQKTIQILSLSVISEEVLEQSVEVLRMVIKKREQVKDAIAKLEEEERKGTEALQWIKGKLDREEAVLSSYVPIFIVEKLFE